MSYYDRAGNPITMDTWIDMSGVRHSEDCVYTGQVDRCDGSCTGEGSS